MTFDTDNRLTFSNFYKDRLVIWLITVSLFSSVFVFTQYKFKDFLIENKIEDNIFYFKIKKECFKNKFYFLYFCDNEKVRDSYQRRVFLISSKNELKNKLNENFSLKFKEFYLLFCKDQKIEKIDCLDLVKGFLKNTY